MLLKPYTPADKSTWDGFIATSKNATFLHHRDYMDYHADRFTDASLLIYEADELVALFPATITTDTVSSHGGLTYGGVLTSKRMTTARMLDIFQQLKTHYKSQGATRLIYKPIPSFYAQLPADEDLYALFINDAALIRRDVASVVFLPERIPFAKGKKYNLSKSRKAGIEIKKTEDWASFWAIETEVLKAHDAKPVHSLEEITQLASAFPANIHLYGAFLDGTMVAGTVLYENRQTVHAQYMGSNPQGQEHGALDAIIAHLLDGPYKTFRYFDFGISTENAGKYLNAGLIAQKEMMGGRAAMYDQYELAF